MRLKLGKVVIGGRRTFIRDKQGAPQFAILNVFWSPWIGLDVRWIYEGHPWPGPLHSHREGFLRMILLGGYEEVREDGKGGVKHRVLRPLSINYIDKNTHHCFPKLLRVPTITFGATLNWRGTRTSTVLFEDGTQYPLSEYVKESEVSAAIRKTMA